AVVVDHGLQPGSAEVAAAAAGTCRRLGLDPVEVRRVTVARSADGPEAAARTARVAALEAAAREHRAPVVLLGHTRDDQAEQVLLGLVRGSGARSLSGMPRARGPLRRPLLDLTREQTRAACRAEGLDWWEDPMNADPAYRRVAARGAVADLERDLGPGVGAALARSADQLRVDADHLDGLAAAAVADLGAGPWSARALADLPTAVRGRVWRRLLLAAGAPGAALSSRHTDACDALLVRWRGQGAVHVPGGLRVARRGGTVSVTRAAAGD
ncbi:MAG TPA: tRNA lysidine(34) synthetase TilS, partial [Dermatophilaceae bacterium]|nr:tRNA lysidine(34) synthetase TilS [Dermatophilaceae bacterium]